MFPGFVSIFKDTKNKIHLYFYPGVTDENDKYYNSLDLSKCNLKYTEQHNSDDSVEYIFENKKIKSITCELIAKTDNHTDIVKLLV